MREVKITNLKNGLKLILVRDTDVHSYHFDFYVNFGGLNQEVIIDNKKVNIPCGVAHFLEHALIEKSKYGNLVELFSKKDIKFNGITNYQRTTYYFSTMHNFRGSIKKLLVALHDKKFKNIDISLIKEPIIEELQGKKDEKFFKLSSLIFRNMFSSLPKRNVIGTLNDINKIDYDILLLCHDIFYVPSNEIIFISGNFIIDDMIKYIESIYDNLSFKDIKYELPKIEETNKVKVKEDSFKTKTNKDYTRISYKIDISKLTSFEKVKLSFYLSYLIDDNFSNRSNLNLNLLKNNITVYDLDCNDNYVDKYLVFEIGTFTNKKEEFVSIIIDKINNLEFNEDKFLIHKNQTIINFLLRDDTLGAFINPFMDNILTFGYYDYDKISDIEDLSFTEYKEMINKLDFSNYTINSFYKEN